MIILIKPNNFEVLKSLKILFTFCVVALCACGNRASAIDSQRQSSVENDMETVNDDTPAVEEWAGADALQPTSIPIVIDFNADWCGPCQAFKPVFHTEAEKWPARAKFISVNVDHYPGLASQFGVRAIPQISVLYPDGQIKTQVGYMDASQFNAFITEALQ